MRRFQFLICSVSLVAATPALAGEEVVYAPPPEWVELGELPGDDVSPGMPLRLYDAQVQVKDGTVWEYSDRAFKVDSPESLTQMGTISAHWLPDKGNLVVHRVDLVRDGQRIDVLDKGARFEILRREALLERRIVSGQLTATLAVPDLRVGDTLRFSFSTTRNDQALGEEAEFSTFLMREPIPLARGRIIAQWPADHGFTYKIRGAEIADKVERIGDTNRFEFDLPVPETEEIPDDAPARFRMQPMLQVSSFDGWNEISQVMAPHFATDGTIADDSPISAEIARIMQATPVPLERAAMATRLVQDEIGYLLNGLDGGNYLPQSPEETWEKRYGDCKAKSLLLLAMLREMGIEAETVLVRTEGGDAIPELLPVPGNFNHMIVRAEIDGETYWLDGTSSGTRLSNIADVPRFGYALPLRSEGAELIPIDMRPKMTADRKMNITIDQSAGLEVPALYDLEMTFTGARIAPFRALEQIGDGEQRKNAIKSVVANLVGSNLGYDQSVELNDDIGEATVRSKGILASGWEMDDANARIVVPFQPASGFSFDSNRAKPEWRNIPVQVSGPIYWETDIIILLPEKGRDFRIVGTPDFARAIGGNEIVSKGELADGRFALNQRIRSLAWEVPASELPAAKRGSFRLARQLPKLEAPGNRRRNWQYKGKDRARLDGIERAFAKVLAAADDDDKQLVYLERGSFRFDTGNWKGALADFDAMIADAPLADSYVLRSIARQQLGNLEGALADLEKAEELRPDGSTTAAQVMLLGLLGRAEEGLKLADEYALIAEDPDQAESQFAYALGWAGRKQEGLAALNELTENVGAKSDMHNQLCWYAGIWDVATEETLEPCRKAVEQTTNSLAALDSRALVYHRLGRNAEAIADLDHVLQASPGQHESRYLRGIVRLANGDEGGRADMEEAAAADPRLERLYSAYGLSHWP